MASSIPLAASGTISSGVAGGVPPGSGPEQQYSLRWNDYHVSILSSFRHLREEEDFVDVTLACDGCSFTAHKVVLSACSPYFRRLLKANPCQHPIVILRDVKQRDMESLLRFMYNGEVHIGQEQLADFLKTAQTLQVRGLADVPTKDPHRLSAGSEHLDWGQHMGAGGRDDVLVTPPPAKRSRANLYPDSPALNSQGDHHRDSLLGQALEGGHQTPFNAHLQSTGEDSSTNDSASDKLEGNNNGHHGSSGRHHGNSEHHLHHHHHHRERDHRDRDMVPKSEPSDYGEDLGEGMDSGSRNPYPAALLGLQGLAGLLPGPSGIHNSNQDSNFGFISWKQEMVDEETGPNSGEIVESGGAAALQSDSAMVTIPPTVAAMLQQPCVLECPLCDASFTDRSCMVTHLNMHYPQDSRLCPVLQCRQMFNHPNSVRNHMRQKHLLQWNKMKLLKSQSYPFVNT